MVRPADQEKIATEKIICYSPQGEKGHATQGVSAGTHRQPQVGLEAEEARGKRGLEYCGACRKEQERPSEQGSDWLVWVISAGYGA